MVFALLISLNYTVRAIARFVQCMYWCKQFREVQCKRGKTGFPCARVFPISPDSCGWPIRGLQSLSQAKRSSSQDYAEFNWPVLVLSPTCPDWTTVVHCTYIIVRLTAWNKVEDTVFGNSDLTTTFRGWQSPGPCGPFEPYGYRTRTGALPTAEGCSKVTFSEHSVLHLVSCCQSNNCVNYNKVYLILYWFLTSVGLHNTTVLHVPICSKVTM